MSDTQENIGKIHSAALPRDAVHIAVVQVTAGEELSRGLHVNKDGLRADPRIGIVDPYISGPIKKGERFYLFLYPNTVEDLVHHYTHPVLDADEVRVKAKVEARKVLMDWIESWNHSNDPDSRSLYEDMLRQYKAKEAFDFQGRWRNEGDYDWDDEGKKEFYALAHIYDALEVITGQKATDEQRKTYYSCCV